MKPTVTRDATHNFQAPGNWDEGTDGKCGDLQVRYEEFGERNIVELFSTWKPNEVEIAHIVRGGVVEIGICAANQPVMQVGVVDPMEPALIKYLAPQEKEKPDIWMNSCWFTKSAHRATAHFEAQRLIGKDGQWIGIDDGLPDGEHAHHADHPSWSAPAAAAAAATITINEHAHGDYHDGER